jgi:hypothetical protein
LVVLYETCAEHVLRTSYKIVPLTKLNKYTVGCYGVEDAETSRPCLVPVLIINPFRPEICPNNIRNSSSYFAKTRTASCSSGSVTVLLLYCGRPVARLVEAPRYKPKVAGSITDGVIGIILPAAL